MVCTYPEGTVCQQSSIIDSGTSRSHISRCYEMNISTPQSRGDWGVEMLVFTMALQGAYSWVCSSGMLAVGLALWR